MNYYDEGWNAYIDGLPYHPLASTSWKTGWKDAEDAKLNGDVLERA